MSAPSPAFDEQMIRRAIRLAMNGRGRVEPNPMVGCLIVKDGRVIGEGFHEQFGGPHAEPNALANCTEPPAGATAYVTLEPCCHTNKKTPPCAPRLIDARLARFVIGCLDPNPQVDGKGVAMLRAAGVEVTAPVLEAEAKQLIAPFIKSRDFPRPYITMKWAETADGKVAGPGGSRLQISNSTSSAAVHRLRGHSDAILIGVNTAVNDDPMLTARDVDHARPLTRYVLDSALRISPTSKLVKTARQIPTVVVPSSLLFYNRTPPAKVAELEAEGVTVIRSVDAEHSSVGVSLAEFFQHLQSKPFTHLLVEPGPTLARSMFGWDDRIWVFRSRMRVNDASAPSAAPVPAQYIKTSELDLGGDTLTEYLNPASPVFFAPVPSADFVLARDGG